MNFALEWKDFERERKMGKAGSVEWELAGREDGDPPFGSNNTRLFRDFFLQIDNFS